MYRRDGEECEERRKEDERGQWRKQDEEMKMKEVKGRRKE